MQKPMEAALEKVRSTLGVTMADLCNILRASLRKHSRVAGRAVLYGPSTCVVRMPGGSWPYAVVRKTRTANWICFSCRAADGSCHHAAAATAAAKEAAVDASDTDAESDDDDGSRLHAAAGRGTAAGHGAAAGNGAAAGPQEDGSGGGAGASGAAASGSDRGKQTPQSMPPRHLVPPRSAQVERALIPLALENPDVVVLVFLAADVCSYCNVGRESETKPREVFVECGEGVTSGVVYTWRCHVCNYRVIPDGRDHGVVFSSSSTAFSEVFLFETGVSLSRSGRSLRHSVYLRVAYWEMSSAHVHPDVDEKLGSVTTIRKAIVLYLTLAIAGLPAAVSRCTKCMRLDGSYTVISFDGLQLGYRLKFMVPFLRPSTPVSAIARASVYARVVKDEALSKALGGVFYSATTEKKNTITTLTAMRGNIMAFIVPAGYVVIDGAERTFAGSTLTQKKSKNERAWDPLEDGGVRLELIEFLRAFFVCGRTGRALAMDILGALLDLIRRVPRPLIEAVKAAAADFSDDANDVSGGSPQDDAGDEDEDAADLDQSGHQDGQDEVPGDSSVAASMGGAPANDGWASDGELSDNGAVTTYEQAMGDDDFGVGPAYEPPEREWDDAAPLRFFAEQFSEPALADTGGDAAAERIRKLVLPLRVGSPCTAASAFKVLEVVRAVVVDPFTVWAPGDEWSAVNAVFDCVLSEDFTVATLSDVVARADVSELRILRGAVTCLAPTLCRSEELRRVFEELLLCLVETRGDHMEDVEDAPPADSDTDSMQARSGGSGLDHGSDEEVLTKEAMVLAHPDQPFTAQQYTNTWLLPEATAAAYATAHGLPVGAAEDFLRTGVWAPGLPPLRSIPGFVVASTAQTDFPNCQPRWASRRRTRGERWGASARASTLSAWAWSCLTSRTARGCPLSSLCSGFRRSPTSSSTTLLALPSRRLSCASPTSPRRCPCVSTGSIGGRATPFAARPCHPTRSCQWMGQTRSPPRSATRCRGGSRTTYVR